MFHPVLVGSQFAELNMHFHPVIDITNSHLRHGRCPHNPPLHSRLLPNSKSPSPSTHPLTLVGVESSVTKYVAAVQKVVSTSGLKSHMHSYGTTIGTHHPAWQVGANR